MQSTRVLLSALTLTAAAAAQWAPLIPTLPQPRSFDLLVGDQNADSVFRMIDWNQDGDYNDAGEVQLFYDGANGSIALGTPSGIAMLANGTALVCDVTTDVVIALRDQNGDGDAMDPGEHWVYFDNNNASGVGMYSMQGICVDYLDRCFIANGDNGQGGSDGIFVLEDLDHDGDVLDPGEVRSYLDIVTTSTGHSNPFDVMVGPDNNLYYTDNGINGPITKGVYRLVDLNQDGDCNDLGENNLFWAPAPATPSPFLGDVVVDQLGRFYVANYGNNELWQLEDNNFDGVVDSSSVYYSTSGSIWWDVSVRDDGALMLCEYSTPGFVTVLDGSSGTVVATARARDTARRCSATARCWSPAALPRST
ncbi:MAG: hypothetical protein H6835_13700 [Planctomycetes bacterium]|nr:hypothetical protein [Planctomycetota bacterium]